MRKPTSGCATSCSPLARCGWSPRTSGRPASSRWPETRSSICMYCLAVKAGEWAGACWRSRRTRARTAFLCTPSRRTPRLVPSTSGRAFAPSPSVTGPRTRRPCPTFSMSGFLEAGRGPWPASTRASAASPEGAAIVWDRRPRWGFPARTAPLPLRPCTVPYGPRCALRWHALRPRCARAPRGHVQTRRLRRHRIPRPPHGSAAEQCWRAEPVLWFDSFESSEGWRGKQKGADRNREAPSKGSAEEDVIRSQTIDSAIPKAGFGAHALTPTAGNQSSRQRKRRRSETGAVSFQLRTRGLGRPHAGCGGTVASSRFTATPCSIARRNVAEPNLLRVDKALLPADENLGLARSGLDDRGPLQNRRDPHLMAINDRRKIREDDRLILGGYPVKRDQALRLLLRHDTNGITS